MARRGNPNWGKPEPIGSVVPTATSFEQAVKKFKLQPVSNPNGVAMLMGAAGIVCFGVRGYKLKIHFPQVDPF